MFCNSARMCTQQSVVVCQAFAADLERLYTGFSSLDAEVVMSASRSGEAMAASLNLDDAQINRLLLQVRAVPFGCWKALQANVTITAILQLAWHVSVYCSGRDGALIVRLIQPGGAS